MGVAAVRRVVLGMMAFGLSGCGTVGVPADRLPPPLGRASFERGLMAYVRGDLDQAEKDLREAGPEDLRARELLRAVLKENGGEPIANLFTGAEV